MTWYIWKNIQKRVINFIFLFEFKLGYNAREALQNENTTFGKGTTIGRTLQRWFQKFDFEEKEGQRRPQEVDDDLLNALVAQNTRTIVLKLVLE